MSKHYDNLLDFISSHAPKDRVESLIADLDALKAEATTARERALDEVESMIGAASKRRPSLGLEMRAFSVMRHLLYELRKPSAIAAAATPRPQTGFDTFFESQMADPEFAAAYAEARAELAQGAAPADPDPELARLEREVARTAVAAMREASDTDECGVYAKSERIRLTSDKEKLARSAMFKHLVAKRNGGTK